MDILNEVEDRKNWRVHLAEIWGNVLEAEGRAHPKAMA